MSKQSPPIKKKDAKIFFKKLFETIEILDIELTDHFICRQKERGIDLIDVEEVLKKGFLKKEYRPDNEHPEWRWGYCKGKVTIVFSVVFGSGHVVLITCWKGTEPKEGQNENSKN